VRRRRGIEEDDLEAEEVLVKEAGKEDGKGES
jgi:hypothetical protein